MKIEKRTRPYIASAIAGLLTPALVASTTATQRHEATTARQVVQKTKAVCVGRLLLDLPADAEVSFTDARVGAVTISVEPGYDTQRAAAAIAEREATLADQTNELGKPSLEKRMIIDGINLQATLLYSGRERAVTRMQDGHPVTGDEGITVEAFALKDDLFYRFRGKRLPHPSMSKPCTTWSGISPRGLPNPFRPNQDFVWRTASSTAQLHRCLTKTSQCSRPSRDIRISRSG